MEMNRRIKIHEKTEATSNFNLITTADLKYRLFYDKTQYILFFPFVLSILHLYQSVLPFHNKEERRGDTIQQQRPNGCVARASRASDYAAYFYSFLSCKM